MRDGKMYLLELREQDHCMHTFIVTEPQNNECEEKPPAKRRLSLSLIFTLEPSD